MTIEPTLKLHGIWPSPEEELVIRAAVTAHEGAVDIWREWLAQNDIDRLSYGSFRLLPLVYRNLNQYGYDGPEVPKLRGAYRQSWYRNQLLVTRTTEIVGKLEDAGVSAILMKGIPLAIRTYRDLGARSMGDGDLLVPLDQVDRVIAVLKDAGWEPKSRARPLVEVQHAMPYRSQDGLELDIHWFVMISHLYEGAVEPFRDGAVPLAVGAANLRAFNVTDELLHTCLHGLNWEFDLPIRWVPDAILSLRRHQDDIDWARFVDVADRLRVSFTVREALEYLVERYDDVPVPAEVLSELRARRRSGSSEHWFRLRSSTGHVWGHLPSRWFRYFRKTRASGSIPTPAGFVRHLRIEWGAPSTVALVVDTGKRLRRRVRWFVTSRLGRSGVDNESDQ